MMSFMRTTFRIDDDLLTELKTRARREQMPLTRLVNRVLRAGLTASGGRNSKRKPHRESTHAMGTPRVELDKALALAAGLEDEEILRKMTLRK
jgi:hypothetical protein